MISVNIPTVRLGYLCRLQTGLTVDASRSLTNDVITRPYLRVANVQSGYLDLDSVSEISVPRAIADRSTLQQGDVLMTEGGDLDKLGRGTVWREELSKCLHQNHIFAIRPNPEMLISEYLALLTQSAYGRFYFESTGVRTTNLASTNSSKILDFPIPLPSIDEQRRIVDHLAAEVAQIDKICKIRNHQLLLLQERRFETIRALLESGISQAARKPTLLTWLPECPEHWKLVPLKHLVRNLDGRRIPLSAEQRAGRNGQYPYYGASFIVDWIDDFIFDEALVLLGEDGAQLANHLQDISFFVQGKIWVNNHAHVLRPERIDGRLLAHILNVFDRNLCMSGATREKITKDALGNITIPLPPAEEQILILKEIETELGRQERIRGLINRQVALLLERRQALVTAAVTGEIDVTTAGRARV